VHLKRCYMDSQGTVCGALQPMHIMHCATCILSQGTVFGASKEETNECMACSMLLPVVVDTVLATRGCQSM
jgi:hypothetical protein